MFSPRITELKQVPALTVGMLHRSSEEEACIKYRSDSDAASYNPLGEVKAWARTTLSQISTNSTRVHTQRVLETSRRTNTSACWVIEKKKWNDRWSSELPTLAVRFLFTNAIRNLWVQFYHFFHSFFFYFWQLWIITSSAFFHGPLYIQWYCLNVWDVT